MRKYYPNYSIGTDAYADIPMVCEKYGTKAVIIGGTHALAAAADLIKEAVADSNIMITGVFEYGGEASREHIDELNSHQEVIDADMIFACGGGKAIDTCKVLSQESNRPFFTFPTIASTCASCTSLGIIYHPDGSLREYSFQEKPSEWIFINTQVIANAPEKYLWAGIGDTMAKFYECTTSARCDNDLDHSTSMGVQISNLCAKPLVKRCRSLRRMSKSYSWKSSGRSHSWNYRFYWFCIKSCWN